MRGIQSITLMVAHGGNVHLQSVSALIEDVFKTLRLPPEYFPIADVHECATPDGWRGPPS